MLPSDVIYACGAPAMVDAVKSIAERVGVVCHADPFLSTTDNLVEQGIRTRAKRWLKKPSARRMDQVALDRSRNQLEQPMLGFGMAEARGE
jgi:3-phenylpropionate/trans-cinnamate dioxygenase ferredoxin reductase subunit